MENMTLNLNLLSDSGSMTEREIDLLLSLGHACEKGYVFEQDLDAAYTCYERAAAAGSPLGFNNLGWLWQNGLGVEQNIDTAVQCYMRAAKEGESTAMVNLGSIYENGEIDGEPDYDACFAWYKEAADLKDPHGMYNLARCYYHGMGVPEDFPKALELFRTLTEMEEPDAFLYMGLCYQEGNGVRKNRKTAFTWYMRGADLGSAECCNQLGVLYGTGEGVPKDLKKAVMWYKCAASLGDMLSYSNVAWHIENGSLGQPDVPTALEWYRVAARAGEEHALEAVERLTDDPEEFLAGEETFYCPAWDQIVGRKQCEQVCNGENLPAAVEEARECCETCNRRWN